MGGFLYFLPLWLSGQKPMTAVPPNFPALSNALPFFLVGAAIRRPRATIGRPYNS